MSGGVDSSVTAALLKNKGYDVTGITMKVLPCPVEEESKQTRKNLCCSLADIEDARKVSHVLSIPHYVLDFCKEFEKEVIGYFIAEYLKGNTPNPCIVCNTRIKFGSLLKKLKSMGIDYLATGHYARLEKNQARGTRHEEQYLLKKGVDENKDQSYVLYGLTQEQMKNILFPLGEYTKDKVRRLAKRLGLPVAEKEESQEICFIPDTNYREFLKTRMNANRNTDERGYFKPGKIVNLEGKVLGEHKGLAFYTVGQREGLNIAYGRPLYVLKIDVKNNSLVVGEEKDTYGSELFVRNLNWLIEKPKIPLKIRAKIRYKHPSAEATIYPQKNGCYKVRFFEPQRAITPGQSVVFYNGDVVLGGGIITK